jgi:hypothetical protein
VKVFCPNCGTDTEGSPGARATCAACTATFEVPSDNAPSRPPEPAPMPPAAPAPRPPGVEVAPRPAQPSMGWSAPPLPAVTPRPAAATSGFNGLAIGSFILALTCCIPLVSPAGGLGLGIVAVQQIETSSPPQGGRGLAIAGIVLGALSAVLQLLWLIGVLIK